ncbi:hypothetical protein B0H13DRAFT_1863151 [Mycena leptocephala]|nr:hypothetical protein B0H13DRAFT_1863151 [Mycena leptocephala]
MLQIKCNIPGSIIQHREDTHQVQYLQLNVPKKYVKYNIPGSTTLYPGYCKRYQGCPEGLGMSNLLPLSFKELGVRSCSPIVPVPGLTTSYPGYRKRYQGCPDGLGIT